MASVLSRPPSEWIAHNDLAFAIWDNYPVAEGHALVLPIREVPTWFDATPEEQLAIVRLIDEVRKIVDDRLRPDGYNVGFNAGEAAGQTVMHLHLHVIPRKWGDMDDPRGGVRHVIPWKGNYRAAPPSHLSRGGELDPFIDHVRPLIRTSADIAIVAAFVQDSGLELLAPCLLYTSPSPRD